MAMTAPRRSAGARHCKRALSGTKSKPLKMPRKVITTIVPGRLGPIDGEGEAGHRQTERAQGQQAIFHLRRRELARQQAADADADPQRGQGKAALPVGQAQLCCVVSQDRRRHEGGDRPDEDLADQGQAEHAVGLDRLPRQAYRRRQPPLGSRRRDRRNRERSNETHGRERRENQPAEPCLAFEGMPERIHPGCRIKRRRGDLSRHSDSPHDRRASDDAREDRQVGDHLEQAVAGGEPFVGQDLGQDPVLGRYEERRLHSEQAQHPQRQPPAVRLKHQGDGPGKHQGQLEHLHRDDHGPLADAVGNEPARQREQEKRTHQDDLDDRRLLTLLGLAHDHGDQEQRDDLLPGLIVELPDRLGRRESPQSAAPGNARCGLLDSNMVPSHHPKFLIHEQSTRQGRNSKSVTRGPAPAPFMILSRPGEPGLWAFFRKPRRFVCRLISRFNHDPPAKTSAGCESGCLLALGRAPLCALRLSKRRAIHYTGR